MSGKALCSSKRPPKDWGPFKVGAYGFAGRVGEAAMRGGAAWEDVWQMLLRLGFDLTLNRALTQAAPHAAARLRQRAAWDTINSRKRISAVERDRVVALNKSLARSHPNQTARFRAIADQLDMKVDRVRYIIEGPRRQKK